METVRHININRIKLETVPLFQIGQEQNAYMAGQYLRPILKFNEKGEFDRCGDLVADSHAEAIIIMKAEAIFEQSTWGQP